MLKTVKSRWGELKKVIHRQRPDSNVWNVHRELHCNWIRKADIPQFAFINKVPWETKKNYSFPRCLKEMKKLFSDYHHQRWFPFFSYSYPRLMLANYYSGAGMKWKKKWRIEQVEHDIRWSGRICFMGKIIKIFSNKTAWTWIPNYIKTYIRRLFIVDGKFPHAVLERKNSLSILVCSEEEKKRKMSVQL